LSQLKDLGFEDGTFDRVVTSGEVGFEVLRWLKTGSAGSDGALLSVTSPRTSSWLSSLTSSLPRGSPETSLKVYVLGSGAEDDLSYVTDAGHTVTKSAHDADVVLGRGTMAVHDEGWTGTGDYEAFVKGRLEVLGRRDTPMICVNPDMIRPDVSKSMMPGTLAAWYEEVGGEVWRVGKPEGMVGECFDGVEEGEWWMVGDSIYTDLGFAGNSKGMGGIWCWGEGIHGDDIR